MAYAQGIALLFLFSGFSYYILRSIFQEKPTCAWTAIILLATILRIFMAGDLYLHDWDERFHAVVAKNIWDTPFSPHLYQDNILSYQFENWAETRLWLNKPFLTFWVLGASVSLFGNNELGLRLPSIIIGLLSIYLTYRIAHLLFEEKTALLAAFLHAIHGMTLEFCGGLISSDHVDNLFTFLFQLSVFGYLRFYHQHRKWMLLLVGLGISLAFLTKWVMAVFLLIVIGATHLIMKKERVKAGGELLLLSLVITGCIGPYLFYLFWRYPAEISYIFSQFIGRAHESFEGHSGGPLFYLEDLLISFGFGILLAIGQMILQWTRQRTIAATILLSWALLPLTTLSFLDTKRITYLEMSAPAYFILTGVLVLYLCKKENLLWGKRWLNRCLIVLLLGLPVQYSIERVSPFRLRFEYKEWRSTLKELQLEQTAGEQTLVLSGEPHFMDAMYYYDLLSYRQLLPPSEVTKFKAAGYLVYEWREDGYLLK